MGLHYCFRFSAWFSGCDQSLSDQHSFEVGFPNFDFLRCIFNRRFAMNNAFVNGLELCPVDLSRHLHEVGRHFRIREFFTIRTISGCASRKQTLSIFIELDVGLRGLLMDKNPRDGNDRRRTILSERKPSWAGIRKQRTDNSLIELNHFKIFDQSSSWRTKQQSSSFSTSTLVAVDKTPAEGKYPVSPLLGGI
jgi:hypothetical protein